MKISIVIPTYNRSKIVINTIERAKLINNSEIILVNDGSRLEEKQILKKIKGIKLVNLVNGGLSAARNTGIRNAVGDYIYFLDDDDDITDEFIEFCNNEELTENIYRFNSDKRNASRDMKVGHYKHRCKEYLNKNNRWYSCNVGTYLIKKDIILLNDLFFDKNILYGEDVPWSISVWMTNIRQKTINISSLIYFVDDTNISLTNPRVYQVEKDINEILKWNLKLKNAEVLARQWLAIYALKSKNRKRGNRDQTPVNVSIKKIVKNQNWKIFKLLPIFEKFTFIKYLFFK